MCFNVRHEQEQESSSDAGWRNTILYVTVSQLGGLRDKTLEALEQLCMESQWKREGLLAQEQELKHAISAATKEKHPSQVLVGASNKQPNQEVPCDSGASEEDSDGSLDVSIPSLEPCSRQSSTSRDPAQTENIVDLQTNSGRDKQVVSSGHSNRSSSSRASQSGEDPQLI